MSIAYYITAHGYGHGARSCDIIRALQQGYPSLPVTVVSDLPPEFLRSRLTGPDVQFRRAAFDVGMVQLDSIRVDVPATLSAVTRVFSRRGALVRAEVDWLKRQRIRVVVSDIPSIPLQAAALADVPRIAVGNFAWDWIYEEFIGRDEGWQEIVDAIREGYHQTDLLLRLPFAEPMSAFPRRQDIPLVATPGQPKRDFIAQLTGANPKKPWVLLSFSTLEWDAKAIARVKKIRSHEFFTVLPLQWPGNNLHAIDREKVSFANLIASCDFVVTKPGFGILSECVVNRKTIIYSERTDFREYPVLEESIRKYLRHAHLPAQQLYSGDLRDALKAAAIAPDPPRRLNAGGDLIAAEKIAAMATGG